MSRGSDHPPPLPANLEAACSRRSPYSQREPGTFHDLALFGSSDHALGLPTPPERPWPFAASSAPCRHDVAASASLDPFHDSSRPDKGSLSLSVLPLGRPPYHACVSRIASAPGAEPS
ncbi:hypothetical protein PMIN06_008805 [Paraphaeosphaeria minitans]